MRPGTSRTAGARPASPAAAAGGGGSGATRVPQPGLFADVRAALSQSLGAVALGVVVCVALVALGWAGEPQAGTGWVDTLRVGALAWLLAHAGRLEVHGEVAASTSPADPLVPVVGVVSLPVLGLVLLAGLLAAQVGRRLAERTWPLPSLLLVGLVAAVHGGAAWLLATTAGLADADPVPAACALGAAAVSGAGALVGAADVHGPAVVDSLPRVVRSQLQRVLPGAAVALTVWLTAGALLVTTGLVLDVSQAVDVTGRLAPGPLGGAVLVVLQVLLLPLLVVWGAALLAGPGVVLGEGRIDLQGSTVTDAPALPLLAALPDAGAAPLWAWGGPLVLVLAGGLAAWHAHRHTSSTGATVADRVADAVAVAALAGTGALLLALVARGSFGPWGPLGADPLAVSACVTGGVLLGGLAVGAALHLLSGRPLLRRRAGRP